MVLYVVSVNARLVLVISIMGGQQRDRLRQERIQFLGVLVERVQLLGELIDAVNGVEERPQRPAHWNIEAVLSQ